jgi:hypothetical protein
MKNDTHYIIELLKNAKTIAKTNFFTKLKGKNKN